MIPAKLLVPHPKLIKNSKIRKAIFRPASGYPLTPHPHWHENCISFQERKTSKQTKEQKLGSTSTNRPTKKNQKQRTKQTKEINEQKSHPNINCGARTCDSLHMFYRHLRLRPTTVKSWMDGGYMWGCHSS